MYTSDLRTLIDAAGGWLVKAAEATRSPHNPRELYGPVLIPGNRVYVMLKNGNLSVQGELTSLTSSGLCVAYYDEDVAPEALLRLVPYDNVAAVIELPPSADDE